MKITPEEKKYVLRIRKVTASKITLPVLQKLVSTAYEKSNKTLRNLSSSQNPQIQILFHEEKGKNETLEAILEAIKGNTVLLKLLS